ncbi:MAG: hypothetical protein AB7O24_11070 [Kofleriaceae bacterium]
MKRYPVIFVLVLACGGTGDDASNRGQAGSAIGASSGSAAATTPTPVEPAQSADCIAIFDRMAAWVRPVTSKLGLTDVDRTSAQNTAGMRACGQLDYATRRCLIERPLGVELWTACGANPVFTFYDSTLLRERLLGAPVTPDGSAKRVAALAGEWTRAAIGALDESVTWKLSANGSLAVTRTSKQRAETDPPRTLVVLRERQLGIKTGTTMQYVPVVIDGPRIHLSWTSGSFGVPLADDDAFVLPLADRDRWLGWSGGPTCPLVDPQLGLAEVPCFFDGQAKQRFVVKDTNGVELAWQRIGKLLVPPGMEVMTRKPARAPGPTQGK